MCSHTERRQTVRHTRQMPTLPRGGGDELAREEQVSSRKVGLNPARLREERQPFVQNVHYLEDKLIMSIIATRNF